MKAKKNKKVEAVQETPVVEAIPVKEPRSWVVNCPKCGASLNLKEGGCAYMCPVCKTLLRVKTGARLVKNVSEGNRNLHVSLTEDAVNYIVSNDMAKKNNAWNLEKLIATNVAGGYSTEEGIVVDADINGLTIRKA